MTANECLELTDLFVVTWQMVGSPPPAFQFKGVPLVWLRFTPLSKVGFTQKFLGGKSARVAELPATINNAVRKNARTRTFIRYLDFLLVVFCPATEPNGFPQGSLAP